MTDVRRIQSPSPSPHPMDGREGRSLCTLDGQREREGNAVASDEPGKEGSAGVGTATRIYVAGPMSGYPELNFPAFHRAAEALRARGYEVVNPAEINADPEAGWNSCMRADIAQLVTCDGVALLPGWEQSRGAVIEAWIAAKLEMRCAAYAEWEAS